MKCFTLEEIHNFEVEFTRGAFFMLSGYLGDSLVRYINNAWCVKMHNWDAIYLSLSDFDSIHRYGGK
jgi:hypothetical protein